RASSRRLLRFTGSIRELSALRSSTGVSPVSFTGSQGCSETHGRDSRATMNSPPCLRARLARAAAQEHLRGDNLFRSFYVVPMVAGLIRRLALARNRLRDYCEELIPHVILPRLTRSQVYARRSEERRVGKGGGSGWMV